MEGKGQLEKTGRVGQGEMGGGGPEGSGPEETGGFEVSEEDDKELAGG